MMQYSREGGGITSAKCTTNLCNMFFKKQSNSEKKHVLESATLLSSGPSTCVKTVVKTAVQPL